MVRLTKNSIIIEIKTTGRPADTFFDLKQALVFALQNQNQGTEEIEKLKGAYLFLLQLLGAMMVEEGELKKKN